MRTLPPFLLVCRFICLVVASSAVNASGADLNPDADPKLLFTVPGVVLKIQTKPRTVITAPPAGNGATVAGEYFDSKYRVFRPLRLRSDYYIHSSPQVRAPRIAVVRDEALNSKMILTGRETQSTTAGKTTEWVEIMARGHRAWIISDALLDGPPPGLIALTQPTQPTPRKVRVPKPVIVQVDPPEPAAPQPKPVVVVAPPAPKPVVVQPPPAPIAQPLPPAPRPAPVAPPPAPVLAPTPKPHLGPICVSTAKDFARNARFQRAMNGNSPFARWEGPFNASIDVGDDGSSVLHHPVDGDIRLNLSICLDASERPYISENGAQVYLQGADFDTVMVPDPRTGQKFQFTRVVN